MLKFQAVAEKTAKNFRGLLFLPHPVEDECSIWSVSPCNVSCDDCQWSGAL